MKSFEYRGFGGDGRPVRGQIQAATRKEARGVLLRRGILAESLGESAAGGGSGSGSLRRADARTAFYRELGAMLRAGLPLVRSLDVLIEQETRGGLRRSLAAARDAVREGLPLVDALDGVVSDLPSVERESLRAGEQSGDPGGACARLAESMERNARAAGELQTALLYPALVVLLSFVLVMVMLVFMQSRFAPVWEGADLDLPLLTRAVMGLGSALAWGAPLLVLGSVLAAVSGRRAWRDEAFRRRVHRRLIRSRFAGAVADLAAVRFGEALSLMLDSGLDILTAMASAGRATGNAWIADQAARQCEEIRRGRTVSDAIRGLDGVGERLSGWSDAGEESGRLSDLLRQAANFYEARWNRGLDRALRVVEPLLLLLVGGIVFAVAMAVLLPILALNQAL
jgi:general secretion pathway protein F